MLLNQSTSIFIALSLLFVASVVYASVQDFCVADLSSPETPSGFPCKDQRGLYNTAALYTGLGVAGNTSNILKAAVTPAFTRQFPGVNGLGISMARLDLAIDGVIPFHTHPRGSELLLVIEGTVCAGFISSYFYWNALKKWDIIVFPQGLLHYVRNCGTGPALAFSSFTSSVPGLTITDYVPFANDFPTEIEAATTMLDAAEIKKLKDVFGGSGTYGHGPY